MNNELIEAAQAVVFRWDSPVWKETEHTGAYIARLRRAVEQAALSQDRMPTNISGFGVVTVGDSFDGYDDDENGGDIHTAGINVGEWSNRIEIYGKGKDAAAEAEVLRDIILAALSQAEPVASVQDVDGFIVENELPALGEDSKVFTFIKTATLRAWMAGHVRVEIPPVMEMEPFQTIDRASKNYKAGWNACRASLLTASKEKGE